VECGLYGAGLSGWAPAFKVFFAPLVDSLYLSTLGRRKTWVVGSQYCIAALMFALAAVCTADDVSLSTITVGFGSLSVLACTQDIAVDSWGLQLPATCAILQLNVLCCQKIQDGGGAEPAFFYYSRAKRTWQMLACSPPGI